MKPRAITPDDFPWFDYSRYSFSLGLALGRDAATLSGHSASEYDPGARKMVVAGDITTQTRTAYAKIDAILGGAGLGFEDCIRVVENVTLTGIDSYAEAERVRAATFGTHRPAVNTVVVHGLLRPAALIEIEVTARRGGGTAYSVDSTGRAAFAPTVEADHVVYLSTIQPFDQNGTLIGEGDVEAQTRQIFRNAERLLADCGLTTADVVKTVEMIRPEALGDYRSTRHPRREYLGPVYPGAVGIVQDRVATDERVLASYDLIASRKPATAVNPGWDRYDNLTYSPAVLTGNTLFMSGQAALDPETTEALHPGDIVAQAAYTYHNIGLVLEAADMTHGNLIKTIEYVTPQGLTDYRGVATVRKGLFRPPFPASTGAICHSLLRPEFLLEVDPTAMVIGE